VFADLDKDLTWFIKRPQIRVLHVETSGTERPVVMEQVAMAEGHGHNKSPFFVLEDAHTKNDDGWAARAKRVVAIHEARRELLAKEEYALDPVTTVAESKSSLIETAWYLERCLKAQREVAVLDGLVVVLAPSVLEKAKDFAENIVSLVRTPSLASVRYIVVELGDELVKPLMKSLGEAVMSTECIVDASYSRQEQNEALAGVADAPEGVSPEASAGFAAPKDVVAPPCFGKPARDVPLSPEASEFLTNNLGPAAALLGEGGARLRRRVAGAALAMQESRFDDALKLQSEAVKQCADAGLVQHAYILEFTLATYLFHAGDKKQSRATFESVASRAEAAGLTDVAIQALLGLGAALAIGKDFKESMRRYTHAASLAEKLQSPVLAIEAYRTAGQIALREHAEKAAVMAWTRALAIAKASPPQDVAHSSAATVARALAKVMQSNGSLAAANSLLAQADEYEAAAFPETDKAVEEAHHAGE